MRLGTHTAVYDSLLGASSLAVGFGMDGCLFNLSEKYKQLSIFRKYMS
jgi:hypothetical protein